MVCTERRAKQESVNPGLTQKEQLCLNVSSSSRKPDFSVTHEDSWREQLGWRARKSELVDLGNKLFWEVSRFIIVGLPLLLDHRNLKAWQTMGFKPDNKVRCRLSSLQSCNFTEKMNISNFPSCWSGDPVSLLPLLRFPWLTMRILKAALCELNYRTFKFTWIDDHLHAEMILYLKHKALLCRDF